MLSQDQTQITVQWVAPDDRGQPVTNYEVNWDAGYGGLPRNVLALVSSNVLQASTTLLVPNLIAGSYY